MTSASIKPITNLFHEEGEDAFYMAVRTETADWHKSAKQYWQSLYEKHYVYLDSNFSKEFSKHCMERLWELTLVNFLAMQSNNGIQLCEVGGRKNISKPDFCFTFGDKKFYVEATSATPGKVDNYPGLNASFEAIDGKARAVSVSEYRERLTTCLQNKIINKTKYKEHIGDNGLIIAISAAQIPRWHQPGNPDIDISCIFPSAPYMSIPLYKRNNSFPPIAGRPYYAWEDGFEKQKSKKLICSNYFLDPEYAHVSAILISHCDYVFFPDIDKYLSCNWGSTRNDFLLIRNPLAPQKIQLPNNVFPVYRETMSKGKDGFFEITWQET